MTIRASDRRPLGSSGLDLPAICYGTSALGDMEVTYGYAVEEERALETLRAIFSIPGGFADTSRNYGFGRSEERIGLALREIGGLPDGFVLSTKLDRDMDTLKFDASRARRSLEESLTALGLDMIPLLHLHDPEYASDLADVDGPGGALEELFKMKEEGLAGAVGLAAGRTDIMIPLLRNWDFDALISHNRFTLTNDNALPMFELAKQRNIAVINAAPYAGGVLAKGVAEHPRYVYQEASEEALEPVRRIEAICARYDIPPGAAALQFSIREPLIASTICGVSKPERIVQTMEWANWPIPDDAWRELTSLQRSSEDPEASRTYQPG